MLVHTLLVAHIIVLGYWLGSDLVINSTFRHLCYSESMPFEYRDGLMDHVLNVDQHVRYALILQLGLGTSVAAFRGYLPGMERTALIAGIFTLTWLALVELTHRLRKSPSATKLAGVDRGIRYVMLVVLLIMGLGTLFGLLPLEFVPTWLSWKLVLFAGVILCGVAIRFEVIRFYKVWQEIRDSGSNLQLEGEIQGTYVRSRTILILLWSAIAGMVILSVWKPQ